MRLDTSRPAGPSKALSAALLAAPLALLVLAASPAQAQRDDQGLQLGCANDYFRLCAGVDPNSPAAEACMTRNRPKLSAECKAAIGDYDRRTGGKRSERPED